MTKYALDANGPFYTIFHGVNMLNALKNMREENQKIMDAWEKGMPMCKFWRVVSGVAHDDRTELLCQLK